MLSISYKKKTISKLVLICWNGLTRIVITFVREVGKFEWSKALLKSCLQMIRFAWMDFFSRENGAKPWSVKKPIYIKSHTHYWWQKKNLLFIVATFGFPLWINNFSDIKVLKLFSIEKNFCQISGFLNEKKTKINNSYMAASLCPTSSKSLVASFPATSIRTSSPPGCYLSCKITEKYSKTVFQSKINKKKFKTKTNLT